MDIIGNTYREVRFQYPLLYNLGKTGQMPDELLEIIHQFAEN